MVDPTLQQLRDIHLPPPISGWPWAPGWWILMGVIVITIACLGYFLRRRFLQNKAKNAALAALWLCRRAYEVDHDGTKASADISILLKRVALAYFPRDRVAYLQGDAWVNFLTETGKKTNFATVRPVLVTWPYQMNQTQSDLMEACFELAQRWIKQRRKPCSN